MADKKLYWIVTWENGNKLCEMFGDKLAIKLFSSPESAEEHVAGSTACRTRPGAMALGGYTLREIRDNHPKIEGYVLYNGTRQTSNFRQFSP